MWRIGVPYGGCVLWRQSDDGTFLLPGDDDHYHRRKPDDFVDDDERVLSRCGRDGVRRRAASRRQTMACMFWALRRRRLPTWRFQAACRSALVRWQTILRRRLRRARRSVALCPESRRLRLRACFRPRTRRLAFVTYTGTGGVVPSYVPQASGAGTLSSIALSTAAGTPVAPVVGVVSADNLTFYAGTSGDNAVHSDHQADGWVV